MRKLLIVAFIIVVSYFFNQKSIPVSTIGQSTLTASSTSTTASSSSELLLVARVVDGDTISVQIGDVIEKIRLIGVNSPESVDPRKPVQCFGKEASDYSKKELLNVKVTLVSDPTQSDRDKYGRLLRYVYLADGTLYNQRLVEEGYAYEYTYAKPYKFQKEFKLSQEKAKNEQRGLWAAGVCNN